MFSCLCVCDGEDCTDSIAIKPPEFLMMILDRGRFVSLAMCMRSTILRAVRWCHYKILNLKMR